MNKLKRFWSNLRGSFWFLPSLIVAGSVAVAVTLIQGAGSEQWMSRWLRLFGASTAGSRGVSCNNPRSSYTPWRNRPPPAQIKVCSI